MQKNTTNNSTMSHPKTLQFYVENVALVKICWTATVSPVLRVVCSLATRYNIKVLCCACFRLRNQF